MTAVGLGDYLPDPLRPVGGPPTEKNTIDELSLLVSYMATMAPLGDPHRARVIRMTMGSRHRLRNRLWLWSVLVSPLGGVVLVLLSLLWKRRKEPSWIGRWKTWDGL